MMAPEIKYSREVLEQILTDAYVDRLRNEDPYAGEPDYV